METNRNREPETKQIEKPTESSTKPQPKTKRNRPPTETKTQQKPKTTTPKISWKQQPEEEVLHNTRRQSGAQTVTDAGCGVEDNENTIGLRSFC